MRKINKNFIVIFVSMSLFLACCVDNEFQTRCQEVGDILQQAKRLVVLSKSKNTVGNDGKILVVSEFDTTEAQKYLDIHRVTVNELYNFFEGKLETNQNAIYLIAFIDEFMRSLTGKPIKENANYLIVITSQDEILVSEWLIDDFFLPVIAMNETMANSWRKKQLPEKREIIKEYFLSFRNQ